MYSTDRKTLLKSFKKDTLRHNEYYDTQPIFDNLYKQSKQGNNFKKLYDIIVSDENIMLAYRTIKRNKGSKTAGTNKRTIEYWENKPLGYFLTYIKRRLSNYLPQKVRRVEIPKPNGKTRPLGIPCIEDRLIQQCIKQVLEPICEAKFHPQSYGFRPNRGAENAIAYVYRKINLDKLYFMVDVDIKGFFDNVNHGKLLKQIWGMGIHDKKVLSIISSMLGAEIEGIGKPEKGVPQGGILSPLLSNIVLNELDWWISNQWESFNTTHKYSERCHKYRHLREKSKLKEMYIVRYADDFKIICRDLNAAKRIFIGVQKWLKDRLGLDISPEKSSIADVRKTNSEFLGFRIKVKPKQNRWVTNTKMSLKAVSHAKEVLKKQIKSIQIFPSSYNIYILNRLIAGLHNYYRLATNVNKDFSRISYDLSYCLKARLKTIRTKSGIKTKEFINKYGHYGGKEIYAKGCIIYPINGIKTKNPTLFTQEITNYTKEGREKLHTNLGYVDRDILRYLANHPDKNKSVEYNDNRLSLYSAQKGMCAITKVPLLFTRVIHHIKPICEGGTDKYSNLIMITYEVHKLIHATDINIITKYLKMVKLSAKALEKLNFYRMKVGNEIIMNV